ncbi:MAG: hypothetical protein H0W36_13930 [Gemmatimonadetes bacterium]|nr:hypothetical protein [Gemmatimonadota bacterium]
MRLFRAWLQPVETGRDHGHPAGRNTLAQQDLPSVPAHDDEPVRPEKGHLERALPAGGGEVGDAGELVDQRYDGADGPPVVQIGGDDDAGERVHHNDVGAGRVELIAKGRRRRGLIPRFRTTGNGGLHFHAPLFQTLQQTPVVQVAAGKAVRVSHRDEGDAQGQSRAPSRAA